MSETMGEFIERKAELTSGDDDNALPYYIKIKDKVVVRCLDEAVRDHVFASIKSKLLEKVAGIG